MGDQLQTRNAWYLLVALKTDGTFLIRILVFFWATCSSCHHFMGRFSISIICHSWRESPSAIFQHSHSGFPAVAGVERSVLSVAARKCLPASSILHIQLNSATAKPGEPVNWVTQLTWGSLPGRQSEERHTEQWRHLGFLLMETFTWEKQNVSDWFWTETFKNCFVCFGLGLHT